MYVCIHRASDPVSLGLWIIIPLGLWIHSKTLFNSLVIFSQARLVYYSLTLGTGL